MRPYRCHKKLTVVEDGETRNFFENWAIKEKVEYVDYGLTKKGKAIKEYFVAEKNRMCFAYPLNFESFMSIELFGCCLGKSPLYPTEAELRGYNKDTPQQDWFWVLLPYISLADPKWCRMTDEEEPEMQLTFEVTLLPKM